MAELGAVEVNETVWLAWPTLKVCWTWAAALKLALPAWLASRTQLPTPVNETTPALIEQTLELVASTVIVTARPLDAVAIGV